MRRYKSTKYIHEGRYAAEVEIELVEHDHEWSPYMSLKDAAKLDDVREALRTGDLAGAARMARVFELTPIAAE